MFLGNPSPRLKLWLWLFFFARRCDLGLVDDRLGSQDSFWSFLVPLALGGRALTGALAPGYAALAVGPYAGRSSDGLAFEGSER